jgi:predicted Co/Zn/Cd cation transporter (cation efflux family)
MTVSDPAHREARALWLSAGAGLVLAVLAVVWGVAAQSQVILFDGVYASLGFVLSWLGLRAAALVEAGPTPRYPFGREALAPLVVAVQALVLLGTFGYAAVDAVLVIAAGGSETAIGSAFAYSIVTLVATTVLWVLLRRRQAGSDLVAAEVAQWRASVLLGVAMVMAFGAAVAIRSTSYAWLRPYVDPTLVLVAAALILPTPVLMLRHAFRELLEGVPDPDVIAPIEQAIAALRVDLHLPPPATRIGKLGRKVYVELDFVVGDDDGWSVADADRIRRRLMTELARPGLIMWLNVELHTDPAWDG